MRIIKQRFNTTFMAALLLALLITLISCAGAIAHPHVFVSSKVDVEFNKDKLTGARLHWTFDTMFSSMIAEEFDGDKNGLLDEAEIASIREGAFSNLSNFNYFTTVEIDNTPLKILEVTDFKAALSDGTLSYSFFIPMSISAGPGHKTIILNQFDPSYYAMLFFAEKEPVLVKGQEGLEVTCKIHENPEEISSGSLTSPWSLEVKIRQKESAAAAVVAAPQMSLPAKINLWQLKLKQEITKQIKLSKTEHSLKPLMFLIFLAFSYGVLHAAGPGHGKAIATSYQLSRREANASGGILLGTLIAFFHGLSAVCMVLILRKILQTSISGSLDSVTRTTQYISYSLISAMGGALFVKSLLEWKKAKEPTVLATAAKPSENRRSILGMAFFTGFVPCPGIVLIMLYCISMNMTGFGIILSCFVTAGMGMTISAVVTMVSSGRGVTMKLMENKPGLAEKTELIMETAASLMMTALGLTLLAALIYSN